MDYSSVGDHVHGMQKVSGLVPGTSSYKELSCTVWEGHLCLAKQLAWTVLTRYINGLALTQNNTDKKQQKRMYNNIFKENVTSHEGFFYFHAKRYENEIVWK